jgi:hypothetical protein
MRSIRIISVVGMLGLLIACDDSNRQTATRFEFPMVPGSVYAVRVWETTPPTQAAIAATLNSRPLAASSAGGIVLVCRPGTAIVEITRFADMQAATGFVRSAPADAPAPSESRVLRVVNSSRQAGAPTTTVVTRESSVQWSEYVMRANANIE